MDCPVGLTDILEKARMRAWQVEAHRPSVPARGPAALPAVKAAELQPRPLWD